MAAVIVDLEVEEEEKRSGFRVKGRGDLRGRAAKERLGERAEALGGSREAAVEEEMERESLEMEKAAAIVVVDGRKR